MRRSAWRMLRLGLGLLALCQGPPASADDGAANPSVPQAMPPAAPAGHTFNERVTTDRAVPGPGTDAAEAIEYDIRHAIETLTGMGVGPFRDRALIQHWLGRVEQFRKELARDQSTDDAATRAAAALDELESLVAFAMRGSVEDRDDSDPILAALARIEQKLAANPAPYWLPPPFDDRDAQAWVLMAARAQAAAQTAIRELQRLSVLDVAPMDPASQRASVRHTAASLSQNVDVISESLLQRAQKTQTQINTALARTREELHAQLNLHDRQMQELRRIDASDREDRQTWFLEAGAELRMLGALDDQLATARSRLALTTALGREPGPAARSRLQAIEELRNYYLLLRQEILGGSSPLPQAQARDGVRLAIAQTVLASRDNPWESHGPVILTSGEVAEQRQDVSRTRVARVDPALYAEFLARSSRESWYYHWEEFGFAAPVQSAEGAWHIWWFTARRYHACADGSLKGSWIAHRAIQGRPIPEGVVQH